MVVGLNVLIRHQHSGQHKPNSNPKLKANVDCFYFLYIPLTWLPNTPMEVAVLVWSGGNHVAASWAGMPRMKI